MKKLLILVLAIVVTYFIANEFYFKNKTEDVSNDVSGVKVLRPSPNELVSFPLQVLLEVSGTGGWAIFEGQAGTAQLFDINGNALTDPEPLTGQSSNYMYDFPQTFFADLGDETTKSKIITKSGYVEFVAATAKDGEVAEVITIPVRFSE